MRRTLDKIALLPLLLAAAAMADRAHALEFTVGIEPDLRSTLGIDEIAEFGLAATLDTDGTLTFASSRLWVNDVDQTDIYNAAAAETALVVNLLTGQSALTRETELYRGVGVNAAGQPTTFNETVVAVQAQTPRLQRLTTLAPGEAGLDLTTAARVLLGSDDSDPVYVAIGGDLALTGITSAADLRSELRAALTGN